MTQAAKAQEPSMEEILASIRRIIADDDAAKSPPRPADPIPPTPTSRPGAAVPPARPVAASPQPRNAPAPAPVGPTPKADEIDAVLNELNKEPGSDMAAPDVLELMAAHRSRMPVSPRVRNRPASRQRSRARLCFGERASSPGRSWRFQEHTLWRRSREMSGGRTLRLEPLSRPKPTLYWPRSFSSIQFSSPSTCPTSSESTRSTKRGRLRSLTCLRESPCHFGCRREEPMTDLACPSPKVPKSTGPSV